MKKLAHRLYFGTRHLYVSFHSTVAMLRFVGFVDLMVLRIAELTVRNRRSSHLIIATAGRGNIGDQALLESAVQHAPHSKIHILVDQHDDLTLPQVTSPRTARFVAAPRLVARLPYLRLLGVWRAGREIGRACQIDVIGADIMDGSYSRRDSVIRLQLVRFATQRGRRVRILGFSWSECPDQYTLSLMRALQDNVSLLPRDPRSAERLRHLGVTTRPPTADIVFTLATGGSDARSRLRLPEDYIIFNASGLASREHRVGCEYHESLRRLLDADRNVVLLPHVLRRGDDDAEVARNLYDQFSSPRLVLVTDQLSPSGVEDVARGAVGGLASRMHLAIFLLRNGVAPLSLASHGKVEGLLEMFDISHRVLYPQDSFGAVAGAQLLDSMQQAADDRVVQARLPEVQRLARNNFGA
ncbi:polysaccharide pyruvyl transferase family protein [Aeromicrobium sp. 50.2.37]|uniref:polysaccharide pyruvyl transferase family protein n=1 Tax=Aeromicrobium sp. 50.2.37 TaxID=2969305 RepID=UPI0021501C04|nr:polysaccharide pyruvyl transferase family protein [Aeromicrobium sp. 50.2.37]MCR4513036.1 polysaccharide pyruvyl transferase family protein [Aeromicrobium sp. 50.2.37]